MELAERFNENGDKQGRHVFLDSYLSWRMVRRVLSRWCRLHCISWRLRKIKEAFLPQGSVVSLWPFMKGDWDGSMRGPVAINNLLWIELFDAAAGDLPPIKKGFYLCENQGWERALIHAWRKHGHGQLIAVPHSTRRFWDLRFVQDPRVYSVASAYPLPRPDLTLVNGKAAWEVFLAEKYPEEMMVECEALRYGYLDKFLHQTPKSRNPGSALIEVLILGDYLPSATIRMLKLLEAAVSQIGDRVKFTLKPHPDFTVEASDYPSLHLRIVTGPLASILRDFDRAYSSNSTSAAVDAYLAGLPVVVMLDASQLNFGPLRGRPGVHFVSTPGELAVALQAAGENAATASDHGEFFFLDPKLPRWTRLLEN
jgi:surface carbohydrate biosynthesis protein (TIGR04326 family)